MVKPPRIRHSKSRKPSVTIDLGPGDVKRADETATEKPSEEQVASTVPDEAATAEGAAGGPAADDVQSEPGAGDESAKSRGTNLFDAAPEPHETAAGDSNEERAFGRPAAPAAGAATSRAGMSAVVGGVIGAAVALAGVGALQWAGVLPGLRGTDATGASLEVLRGEVAVLRQELAANRAAAETPEATDAAAESDARIQELNAAVGQLRAEVNNLQGSIPQEGGGGDPEAMQALQDRLAEIETTVAALSRETGDFEELSGRIASLAEAQRAATEGAAARASRIEQIEAKVTELSRTVEEQAAEPGMMLAVAAAALKSAIDRGTPFMTELETFAAVAPDSPDIAALRDLAASGVPTHEQIEAETADAADRMIAAAKPTDPDAGFLDQLWSSAQSLVQVRPVGRVEGASTSAIVARMEVALREGDYEKALQEYEALPEPAKAAGADFIEKVRARHTADQLIAKALSGATRTPGGEG